jgi:hypothetical protein
MSEVSQASAQRRSTIKHVTALVAALAALITSIAAIVKPQDDSMTNRSYGELRKAVQDLTTATTQNHDDVIALRSYLLGYANATSGQGPTPPSPSPSPSPSIVVDAGAPNLADAPEHAITGGKMKPPTTSPIPTVHARPSVRELPDYDSFKSAK